MTFQRILIAVDASELGPRVAQVGFELARALGATTALVHAIGPLLATPHEPGADLVKRAAIELLDEIAAHAAPSPIARFTPYGDRATEIETTARDWQADLIVIGTRTRGKIARVLVGSVADAVVRSAPCPVLVVPAVSEA